MLVRDGIEKVGDPKSIPSEIHFNITYRMF